jgi:PPM family protein phosphatase
MKLSFAGDSDVGCVRTSNQDSYHIDPDGRFFIVADGMGGHAGGEEASRITTESIGAYLDLEWGKSLSPQDLLQQAVLKANQAILHDQNIHPVRGDSGTTVVVVMFIDEQPWFCHIGDSRLYRLRGPRLEQVSEDHTWIARAVQTGAVSTDEARSHPWRHMLLQCLGREDVKEVTAQKVEFQPGDRLLLCSDGLTEELTDERIASQLKGNRSCHKATEALIKAAKSHGGRDNVTVVVIARELNE